VIDTTNSSSLYFAGSRSSPCGVNPNSDVSHLRLATAIVCGAISGVAVWSAAGRLAIGTLAGTPQATGLLPSLTWLAAAALGGGAIAAAAAVRGNAPPALFLLPSVGLAGWTMVPSWPAVVAWAAPAIVVPVALLAVGIVISATRTARSASTGETAVTALVERVATRRGPLVAAVSTALWLCCLLLTWLPRPLDGDEPHYLVAAQSILSDGDVDLKNNYDEQTYRAFYGGVLQPRHAVLVPLGQEYPFHGLGVSVLVLPLFAFGGALGARITMIAVTAIGAGFFWSAARRMTGSTSAAWIAWVTLISSAPFALHGVLIYPDGVGAAATSIAVWALVIWSGTSSVGVSAMVGVSIALATLPWLHVRLSSAAGVLGLAILTALHLRRRHDTILPFMAAPIISFTLWIASTWVMFETLDPTHTTRQGVAGSAYAMPVGMLGTLFDAEYGLLPYAPVMALAALGIRATWRRSPLVAGWTVLLTLATLGVGSAWAWFGGDSAPARFLTPVLPLICLWLACWWTQASLGARSFAGATIVLGACITLAIGIAERGFYVTNIADGRGTIFEWLSPNVELALGLPSLFREDAAPATEAVVAGVWVLIGALAFATAVLWSRRRAGEQGGAWLVASTSVLAWMMLAVTAAWRWQGDTPWSPDRGQLRLIRAAASPALTVSTRAPATRVVSREEALSSLQIAMPLADTPVALHVPFVPAGRYAIKGELANHASTSGAAVSRSNASPMLSLLLGRDALPFATWPAHDLSQAPTFALAVPLYALRVEVESGSPLAAGAVRLQPLAVSAPPLTVDVATRATRYGDLVVYSFDPYTYPLQDGFWLAADRTGRVVIADFDGQPAAAALTVTAEDAATTVTLSQGSFNGTLKLPPRVTDRIVVPANPDEPHLWFTVAGGSSIAAGDGRRLGVFVRVARGPISGR
jgi:hypothetical protein